LAQAADDLVRVGADGTIRALPADAVVGPAEPKLAGQYGCQYPHIGSIYFGDGWATWADVNRHSYIKHDYSQAKAVCMGRVQTHFRQRCQELETANRAATNHLDHLRFATGLNRATGALYITIKALRHGGIYNEKAPFMKPYDTIVYHPEEDDWLGYASFCPERYTMMDLFDGDGCAFISYLNGVPYIHPMRGDEYNKFYGASCDRVVGITLNKYPDKIKIGLSIEVQDRMLWYLHEVTTDDPLFISEIPASMWEFSEQKWNAGFLFNANSRGGLFGNVVNHAGEPTRGYEINCTFVRDNTDGLKYNTIDDAKRTLYDELDMIIFNFITSEQSGLTPTQ
jgi:hypothetical protein